MSQLNTKHAAAESWGTVAKIVSDQPGLPKELYFFVKYQDGPIADVGVNGICMLDIAQSMMDRLSDFEAKWPREENRQAIIKLREFQLWLQEKRRNRLQERMTASVQA